MNKVGNRLKTLRENLHLSQKKIADMIGIAQTSIYRYEVGQAEPNIKALLWYADYFDVSMDYIFGRTDNPQGKLYEYTPKLQESDPEIEKFIEMCFDPSSPISERLKETLAMMLHETRKKE